MPIDEIINELEESKDYSVSDPASDEALDNAIILLRKYQKIPDILTGVLWDIYMSGVNMDGEYQGCWVRFKDIENILNGHFREIIQEEKQ